MAFTRSFLKSVGLTDDQITAVMDEHTTVTDGLKQQRDNYKAEAEKLPGVQKQLDDLKGGEDYRDKYEKEHAAYEAYKTEVAKEAETAKVKAAYRKLLADEKISEKRLDAVLRLTDFDGMKLDKDGNLEGADKLREAIKKEWGEYITTTAERGATVENPPTVSHKALTREDIFKRDDHGRYVLSTEERQKAIAENPQAFK